MNRIGLGGWCCLKTGGAGDMVGNICGGWTLNRNPRSYGDAWVRWWCGRRLIGLKWLSLLRRWGSSWIRLGTSSGECAIGEACPQQYGWFPRQRSRQSASSGLDIVSEGGAPAQVPLGQSWPPCAKGNIEVYACHDSQNSDMTKSENPKGIKSARAALHATTPLPIMYLAQRSCAGTTLTCTVFQVQSLLRRDSCGGPAICWGRLSPLWLNSPDDVRSLILRQIPEEDDDEDPCGGILLSISSGTEEMTEDDVMDIEEEDEDADMDIETDEEVWEDDEWILEMDEVVH
ncbi:hypothetical protein Tco_1466784 [Tanacetum coccineum]